MASPVSAIQIKYFIAYLTTQFQRSHHYVNGFSTINHSNFNTYLMTTLQRSHHFVNGFSSISYSNQILHCLSDHTISEIPPLYKWLLHDQPLKLQYLSDDNTSEIPPFCQWLLQYQLFKSNTSLLI